MTKRNHDHEPVTDAEVERILARAAELDAQRDPHLSLVDLRQIAADANIHPAALERALLELAAKDRTPMRARDKSPLKSILFMLLGAALGGLAVWTDSLGLGPESAAAVFGPTAAFTIWRSLRHRWLGEPRAFLSEAVLTFGVFTLTATLAGGTHATTPALTWSLACTAVGSVISGLDLRLRRLDAPDKMD